MANTIDTIEGTIRDMWFHYDVGNDVLYIRLQSKRNTPTLGEETDDGFILLRDKKSDQAVGITVVNWWQRFGKGTLPDSISEIQKQIKPWGKKLAA